MKVLMPGQKPPRDLHDPLADPGEHLQGSHLVGVSRTESDAYTDWLWQIGAWSASSIHKQSSFSRSREFRPRGTGHLARKRNTT